MKIQILFISIILILAGGCSDKDELTPSEGLEFSYSLPQGEHDYDAKIMDWFERYGFYALYRFAPEKDLYWNGSFSNKMTNDKFSGIHGEMANEIYVGEQLQLLEESFLNFYQDSTLYRCMPMKLLLCSTLQKATCGVVADIDVYTEGLDVIAVNHGNENIKEFSADKRNSFKDAINVAFLQRMISTGKIGVWEEFSSISEYRATSSESYFARGFIGGYYSSREPDTDLASYLEAILTIPDEILYAESTAGDNSYKGILHSSKDTHGLIKIKYNLVVKYYKERYQIDLLKIRDFKFK
ncbi:putative zinc-binding metallopeptidase [Butyricimonas sp. Marseille-P3923]|uniref:putative zinc-binding metallopeptidase n=1 Tax=Butyricimonas sp. Marseille-P3923 TaxID=1987504 RepID=UPI000C07F77B|nr:putative zinc-binding metallopeptidase [Butyricimonas sp. Marseille-P3923]